MNNQEIYEAINALQKEISEKHNQIKSLRATITPQKIEDYSLTDFDGGSKKISSLFNDKKQLLVIHNMGKKCSYCTLWADELNGIRKPLGDAIPFVVVTPDAPAVQKEFAQSRGWEFQMLSAVNTNFIETMGFEPKPNHYWPGVSVLVLKEDGIYKYSHDTFGPGDPYCAVWHYLDLLPTEVKWHPKFDY